MPDLTAQRTLVKSHPELWTELSEVEALARHLGDLGEIRITKVEPESTVAWEGEQISGTVELEQSGWGTKVTLSATVPEPGPTASAPEATAADPEVIAPEPEATAPKPEPEAIAPEPEPQPNAEADPDLEQEPARVGFWARLFGRRAPEAVAEPAPEPPEAQPEPEAVAAKPELVAAEAEPAAVAPGEPEPAAEEPEPAVADQDPEPAAADPERVQRVLEVTLDALGQAHHRPFSRG